MKKPRPFDLSVYFIADPELCGGRDLADVVCAAVDGGASMVQLRNKTGRMGEFAAQAAMLAELLKPRQEVSFIVNDNPHIAFAAGADGVHLGQGDMSAKEARQIMGEDKIIGLTAFEETHFQNIDPDVIDYAGTGPFFQTLTKPDKKVLGPQGFKNLVRISPVRIVGIGGITPQNAGEVIQAGADGVAMMRGIAEAADPRLAARQYSQAVRAARN